MHYIILNQSKEKLQKVLKFEKINLKRYEAASDR